MRSERRGMAGTLRAPRYFASLERFEGGRTVRLTARLYSPPPCRRAAPSQGPLDDSGDPPVFSQNSAARARPWHEDC